MTFLADELAVEHAFPRVSSIAPYAAHSHGSSVMELGSEAHVRSCGVRGEQSGTGQDFLRVLRYPLPILIPPTENFLVSFHEIVAA